MCSKDNYLFYFFYYLLIILLTYQIAPSIIFSENSISPIDKRSRENLRLLSMLVSVLIIRVHVPLEVFSHLMFIKIYAPKHVSSNTFPLLARRARWWMIIMRANEIKSESSLGKRAANCLWLVKIIIACGRFLNFKETLRF